MIRIRACVLPAALAAIACTAAAPWVAPRGVPVARAADAVDEAIEKFNERMKGADTQGKRTAIAEIALKKDPRVADAFLKYLRDPDDDVKIAICQNIGKQKDPKVAGPLKAIAEDKKNREKPKLVAAAVEGVGECDAKRNYKFLSDIAKKQLDYDGDIASAAIRAMANFPDRETVDDIIGILGSADYVTTKDSAQKKAARGAAKPVCIEMLKKLTNQAIDDVKVWQEWWKENKKTWKPTAPGEEVDINASMDYEDSAYKFRVTRPSKAWNFRKSPDKPDLSIEAMDEGQKAAWVTIQPVGTKNLKSKTPEAMEEEQRPNWESKMKDVKEGAVWGRKSRFAGETSCEDDFFGRHADHDAISVHNVYVEKDGVIFIINGVWKSGKSKALEEDIDKILDSFKFL